MNRRISPKAILILFVVLILVVLPLTIGGILYMQGNKDPQAMFSALERRFVPAATRVVYVTPTPGGTPGKVIAPTPTPTPVDITIEAAKKVDDAKKFGGAVSTELGTNPATRGFVGFLGQQLPKEWPIVGGKPFGDTVIGFLLLMVFLVIVAGVIAKVTKSPREQIMGSETVQSFLDDFWTWFVRMAGLAIYVAVIAANIQTNPIKAFLLPAGFAIVILFLRLIYEELTTKAVEQASKANIVFSNQVVDFGKGCLGLIFSAVKAVVTFIVVLFIFFGGLVAVTSSGKDPVKFSADITKILMNIPWVSKVASEQMTAFANFMTGVISFSALLAPNGDLSIIGSLVGTILLFQDVKISGMLKRTEQAEQE